jgi:sulfite reductase (NADPH) hemoprotein beta-component
MYKYDFYDEAFVNARVEEFRDQVARRLNGSLTDDEFKPLRLKNGLYLQLHAYMLRVAIPYGTLSSTQLRALAAIATKYDKGYGHISTRQNIQFNWINLEDVADILADLAKVEMHALQTSGNCIRNVTADPLAGVAIDEFIDPRPVAELIRQWSSAHPEFSYLPRKFKIAVSAGIEDRAITKAHDIGIRISGNGYAVSVGGGLGRTPMIGKVVRENLPPGQLLNYLEAIMRVYNAEGRRDNKYKARVKILVHETGLEPFKAKVEAEFATVNTVNETLEKAEMARLHGFFTSPKFEKKTNITLNFDASFVKNNLIAHKQPGYTAVHISLKPIGGVPGDVTSQQMLAIADLADAYSFGEIRTTVVQNFILPHVALDQVEELYHKLVDLKLATPNNGLITDIIACPGLDYCALATARSIPIAQKISEKFGSEARQNEIGPLSVKISGCINACGHHHIGAIGILGLEKRGQESYQITIGGEAGENTTIGEIIGPGVVAEEVPNVIEKIVNVYLSERKPGETFASNVIRRGVAPFKAIFEEAKHAS